MRDLYTPTFYDQIRPGTISSAGVVAELITGALMAPLVEWRGRSPREISLLDVGGGEGHWARAIAREVGGCIAECWDGPGVEHPVVPFRQVDIAQPLPDLPNVDVVICLEAAEHLPPERAPGLVEDLCRLAPIVLFSGAVPGQPGTGHVNCQPPAFWGYLFAAAGYIGTGGIRHLIWQNEAVEWWYAQNLLLFAEPNYLDRIAQELPALTPDGCPYLIHPTLYEYGWRQPAGTPGAVA